MSKPNHQEKRQQDIPARPQMAEVFGFQVPTSNYYLYQGHTWAMVEKEDRVRVGVDDFSQKLLGPADKIKLPTIGKVYYQDHICMALFRQGHKAPFLAPVDGVIEEINPKVRQNPGLVHNDPYGDGWLFLVKPANIQRNLETLSYGEANVAWIDRESHRLLSLMETTVGVTLPSGGAVIDDVYGHYPRLGWRPLVQSFFLPVLARSWKRRSGPDSGDFLAEDEESLIMLKREVLRVLNRTYVDKDFCRALEDMRSEALEPYKLDSAAKTAILSGDLKWLNEHIGELTQKQLMFVLSCLLPATTA